jgi:SAM-dependent methyltransferase
MIENDNWNKHWEEQNDFSNFNPGQFFRHQLVFNEINKIRNDKQTLLDFGSGQGDLIKKLSTKFKKIRMFGIEYSLTGIMISKKNNPNAKFIQADLMSPSLNLAKFNVETFDVITCCDVLEHVDNPVAVITHAYKLLSSNGALIITVPGGPMTSLDYHIGHRLHYDKYSLQKVIKSSGFKKFKIYNAGWPFFNLYRIMLLVRGVKLVNDISNRPSCLKRSVIKTLGYLFSFLFKFNLNNTKYGWQMIAIVRK